MTETNESAASVDDGAGAAELSPAAASEAADIEMADPAVEAGPGSSSVPALEPSAEHTASVDVRALPGGLRAGLEAVLMVVPEPVPAINLAAALNVPQPEVENALAELAREYETDQRGFQLREVDGGWRIYSTPAFAAVVGHFIVDGATSRLSQAALETLAVIAYRQPVTRAHISSVRGVNVDSVLRTLTSRGLVAETGVEPTTGAILYGTTTYFLERMGLGSVDQLPPIAPYLPELDDDLIDQ